MSTLVEFHEWIADPNHVNPISIHCSTDNPDQGVGYYPMFALAYTYLVDAEFGHGTTVSDMRYLFQLMKEGEPFEEAFEMALHMSVTFYRDNFYTLMESYLEDTEKVTGKTLAEKVNYHTKFPEGY